MSDCKVSVSSEFSIYTIFWRDEDGDVRSDSRKHINTATNLFCIQRRACCPVRLCILDENLELHELRRFPEKNAESGKKG